MRGTAGASRRYTQRIVTGSLFVFVNAKIIGEECGIQLVPDTTMDYLLEIGFCDL